MSKPMPQVGQIYRDIYDDKRTPNLRTIKVVQVLPNGVRARVLTNSAGETVDRPRATILMTKTLHAGYVLVQGAP